MEKNGVIKVSKQVEETVVKVLKEFQNDKTLFVSPTRVVERSPIDGVIEGLARGVMEALTGLAQKISEQALESDMEDLANQLMGDGLNEDTAKKVAGLYKVAYERSLLLRLYHEFLEHFETNVTVGDEYAGVRVILSVVGYDDKKIDELLKKVVNDDDKTNDRDVF